VKFTKLAKTFAAEVEVAVAANGPWFDAMSIVKVMAATESSGGASLKEVVATAHELSPS
jgi:phosphocarrier protein